MSIGLLKAAVLLLTGIVCGLVGSILGLPDFVSLLPVALLMGHFVVRLQ